MTVPSSDPSVVPRRLRWPRAALGLVLALVGGYLLYREPAPLLELRRIQVSALAAMTALMLANQLLNSWRFALALQHCADVRLSQLTWFRLASVAQFLNLFVPQLGNVQRATVLQREHGVSYLSYATGLFVSVWFDILAGLLLASIVLGASGREFRLMGSVPTLPLVVGTSIVGLLGPVLLSKGLSAARFDTAWLRRTQGSLTRLLHGASSALRAPGFLLRLLLLNLLVAVVHVSTFSIAFAAVGNPIGLERLMLFQIFARLSNQVPLTPGNLGYTELAYGVLADASAGGLQSGIAVALLVRVLGTVIIVGLGVTLGGLPLLWPRSTQQR